MSDSVQPHRPQPTRLLCPWDSPGKNTGVGYHFLLQWMKVKSLSRVRLFVTPWTAAYQAPPSMGFSRQYWSGLPFPPPGDLPHPGIEPASLMSPALAGRFSTVLHNKACFQKSSCSFTVWHFSYVKEREVSPEFSLGSFSFL